MSAEYLKSLGHYVYGYLEIEDRYDREYAYIGVGQNSRCLDHLKEDKSGHPEFQEYLRSIDYSTNMLVIIASGLESQRAAEVLESWLISQKDPRLNRNSGMVRGANYTPMTFDTGLCLYLASQWDTAKCTDELVKKYGISLFLDCHEFRKNASSVKIWTNNKAGFFHFISFEKKGITFGLGATKGADASAQLETTNSMGLTLVPDNDKTRASQDFYITEITSDEMERKCVEFIINQNRGGDNGKSSEEEPTVSE